jgi:hypothetical protein
MKLQESRNQGVIGIPLTIDGHQTHVCLTQTYFVFPNGDCLYWSLNAPLESAIVHHIGSQNWDVVLKSKGEVSDYVRVRLDDAYITVSKMTSGTGGEERCVKHELEVSKVDSSLLFAEVIPTISGESVLSQIEDEQGQSLSPLYPSPFEPVSEVEEGVAEYQLQIQSGEREEGDEYEGVLAVFRSGPEGLESVIA